ncbi:MAG: primosomal protein N', partial [Oscillospiraceae bacterium]|nr:primosomal protein N' [Oscillospiraceae bacterium]
MNQPIARLAVSGIPYAADKLYSYLIPSQLADSVRPGMRVSIPFGRGNRRTEGFVLERLEGDAAKLKPIQSVMDSEPLMDGEEMRLVKWMKARYFCTYYDAIKTILPAGVWFRYREKYRANDDLDWKSLQLE